MAAAHGRANGANGLNGLGASFPPARFSKVPSSITVAVAEEEGPIDVEITLDDDIQDDPTELCTLLENEQGAKLTWVTVAIAYAKHKKLDVAVEVLTKANVVFARAPIGDRLSILNGLCWLYLLKCREAPRMTIDGQANPDTRTKDFYIQAATSVLNDASRISPSYPPLYLARGVLYLLRSSLQAPSTSAGTNQLSSERMDTLKQAAKCFEDALRSSTGKNLMAKMGKARVNYSMGKYADALKAYQNVLQSSPDLIDPDPRIGIGCCFWQLGFKDDAAGAWQRSLDLNPESKVARVLLGVYNLQLTAPLSKNDERLVELTKKAIESFIIPSLRKDNMYPLTCAALGSYFVQVRQFDKMEALAKRAIELTDVGAVASDGWYQLARKEHYLGNTAKATDYYTKADQARGGDPRGGDDRGYIPAKFGSAQMLVLKQDYDGAKFRLEKIIQHQPAIEAQVLLGTLYAEDVFTAQANNSQEDKSSEMKKALKYLEDVTKAWKDPKKNVQPETTVLLNLARLYEVDHPDKSLKCLEEVEKMELRSVFDEEGPEDIMSMAEPDRSNAIREFLADPDRSNNLREFLPPQLLNNMACFHYQAERFSNASELFEAALNACVSASNRDETIDADTLVTSISYNLGRTYECMGKLDEARKTLEGLLQRHPGYIDARIRLAYIALRQNPNDEGPAAVSKLFKENEDNIEVRALYGWYTSKSKKKTLQFAEDQEQRHYKHTLQKVDKHDRYSLTGMGNISLAIAREMRRDTEQDKEKRRKTYERAVEFFDKVLQLDPKNAYAAQGIAIALAEDKKDYSTALQIFTKVKETLKDYTVYMNLGHTFCEIKQYSRAIENYELAMAKDKARDPTILACLGRVWLLRGKHEKSLPAMKTALEYSQRALDVAPDQVHFQFNVAFVQIQIAQLVYQLPDAQRTLEEVRAAAVGLDEAIESFSAIAKSPNPPFPKNDIEQRANMGRNTMRKQLERSLQSQQKYEEQNAGKLQRARELREAEQRKREEAKQKELEAAADRKRKMLEERQKLQERDREYMEKRREEERRRQELIDDSEMRRTERGSRKKGGKRKKKSEMDDSETEGGDTDGGDRPRSRRRRTTASGTEGLTDEERPRQKKRKLERKNKEPVGKYKSAATIVNSDSEGEADNPADESAAANGEANDSAEEGVAAPRPRKARIVDEDDEDEAGSPAAPNGTDMAVADEDEDE